MPIRKAMITAAGRGARLQPAADTVQKSMLPMVDRDGLTKPVIQIIAEEAFQSGIEALCLVTAPGDEERYRAQFAALRDTWRASGTEAARQQIERIDEFLERTSYVVQEEPRGYGHAVQCGRAFVGDEAFLLLLGDHLYVSDDPERPCVRQLVEVAERENCAVSAVHALREQFIGYYGTLAGERLPKSDGLHRIRRILEKPSLSRAELELHTPGLRTGHYLCFFGMHALTPRVFALLERAQQDDQELPLTPSLDELAREETYLALEVRGMRYDIGTRFGLLRTQIALAMAGSTRDELLTTLAETLAECRARNGNVAP